MNQRGIHIGPLTNIDLVTDWRLFGALLRPNWGCRYLDKFVVTLGCGATFQWATSDDLIVWSEPQIIDIKHNMPANQSKVVVAMNYPTLLVSWPPFSLSSSSLSLSLLLLLLLCDVVVVALCYRTLPVVLTNT